MSDNGFETFQSTTRQRVCQRMADRLAHKITMSNNIILVLKDQQDWIGPPQNGRIHPDARMVGDEPEQDMIDYMEAELARQHETRDALLAEIAAAIPKPKLRIVQ